MRVLTSTTLPAGYKGTFWTSESRMGTIYHFYDDPGAHAVPEPELDELASEDASRYWHLMDRPGRAQLFNLDPSLPRGLKELAS